MKRREGVFSPKAQKWYVFNVSCIVKNSIMKGDLYITFRCTKCYIDYTLNDFTYAWGSWSSQTCCLVLNSKHLRTSHQQYERRHTPLS
jgi:hypothetical protein